MRLSVVIPAHNEAQNIAQAVETFLAALSEKAREVLCEIILVENGSKDNTLDVCRELVAKHPGMIRVFSLPRGSYGEAIKRGMLESAGTHIAILECDFLDVDFVDASMRQIASGGGRFIVASKRHPASVDNRPFKRRMLTLGFNLILRFSVAYPGSDTHGLKTIEAGLARELCTLAETTDEVFQTEIVLLAWSRGETIEELPIFLRELRPTPVSVSRRLPKVMLLVQELRRSLKRFRGRAKGRVVRVR